MKLLILLISVTFAIPAWSNADGDDRSSEAGSTDMEKCTGQCVSPQHSQSLARWSPDKVRKAAAMIFGDGKTSDKATEESKALKEKGN